MIWSCSKCPGSFFEEENSSRAVHQRANTSQRLGRPQRAAPAHLDRTAGAPVAPGRSSACSRWIMWILIAIPAQASRCGL